ncbi:hypothetical protein M8C21_021257 [Ambrosia artemisiifolia]|uniref:Uncharacterized protein n=1 Tax=Ambrosia artemisiifolia TaxID=4212 RepID=A0AAD5D5M8_AMBAR|nr:hypothetical protein M8C21_021257 [Ambrosia artemisiifolia]
MNIYVSSKTLNSMSSIHNKFTGLFCFTRCHLHPHQPPTGVT